MKKNYFYYLTIFLWSFWACQSIPPSGSPEYAFVGVQVIPMNTESILADQTVWIREGKIFKMGLSSSVSLPDYVEKIDASQQYLLPGLAEMHAHIPPQRSGDELIEETLFLYVSQGITLIRGMLGEDYHLTLREKVANGALLGPRIYTSGPSLNGNRSPDVETAINMVRDQKEAGYDFLKLHPGLKREVFDAMVETAQEVDISYAGHVSVDVGIARALEAPYASIDHLDGYVEGLVPEDAGVEADENGFFGVNFTDLVDKKRLDSLIQQTREAGVWIVPTQSMIRRWISERSADSLAQEPEMKYMSADQIDRWKQGKYAMVNYEDYDPARINRFLELRAEIILAMQEGGVDLLLGSDAPQVFNVPGFSIHHELTSLIDAGLSPYQALRSGTANPARYFDAEGQYGTIVQGAAADLILLDQNPLESVDNLRNPAGVMLGGTWLPRTELEKRLAEIADRHKRE